MAKIIGYITYQNLSQRWSGGSGLASEDSLSLLTDITGLSINPTTAGTIQMMYGSTTNQDLVVTHGHAHSNLVAPYLYTDASGTHGTTLTYIVNNNKQSTLAVNLKNWLVAHDCDGVCIDCEDGSSTSVINTIVAAIFAQLNPIGKFIDITGRPYTSTNVALGTASYLRYVQIMAYDMGWDPNTGGYPQASYTDFVNSCNLWVNAGWPKSKLVPGIPIYGRTAYVTSLTPKQESMQFYDIITQNSNAYNLDYATLTGAGGSRSFWWGSHTTDEQKAAYAMTNGFAGVMIFALGYDRLNTANSLTQAIYTQVNSSSGVSVSVPKATGSGLAHVPTINIIGATSISAEIAEAFALAFNPTVLITGSAQVDAPVAAATARAYEPIVNINPDTTDATKSYFPVRAINAYSRPRSYDVHFPIRNIGVN